MRPLLSWGRLEAVAHDVVALGSPETAAAQIARSKPGVAHGMGRSYGDVCLNPGGTVWQTTALDRFSHFDAESGILTCGAGVLLRDIQRLGLSRGWMLPVTPGTQLVTVGGAIANDVHGKNHHGFGSFGDHVLRLRLLRTDGEIIECGPRERPEWFAATIGGLGLTGVILEADLQLRPVPGPWLEAETVPFTDLPDFFRLSDESARSWEHSVSWIDCTPGNIGRGLFMRANPVATDPDRPLPAKKRPLSMPLTPPLSLVNGLSLKPFNALYFNMGKRKAGERQIVHYEPFLYPLDNINEWNRMYGPKGFYQYQSVVPREGGEATVRAMLDEIAASGNGSFLAVLKTFGDRRSLGMLGFPRPGITLALDFRNNGVATEKLFTRLDAIVAETGGAIYPAKDARMPRSLFEAGYPRLGEFLKFRDPGIRSGLSRRLIGS